jgi:hypothetical protein
LQELIEPPEVELFSGNWVKFGTRRSISIILSGITSIDLENLQNPTSERLFEVSIAKRMSWASSRETTRVEDMAYCLLGLFNVHIPPLHGEGKKAFIRLQEEIMKHSQDPSLLAWGVIFNESDIVTSRSGNPGGGLLAQSPSAFRFSTTIVSFRPRYKAAPYAMTNRGLSTKFAIRRNFKGGDIVLLNCYLLNDLDHRLAILLSRSDRYDNRLYLVPRSEIEFGEQDSKFKYEIRYFPDSISNNNFSKIDPRTNWVCIPRSKNLPYYESGAKFVTGPGLLVGLA